MCILLVPLDEAERTDAKSLPLTQKRPTVLLTGFEPFTTGQGLILNNNPTAQIVQRVAAESDHIHAAVLPVSYQRTPPALLQLFKEIRPRFWLGLGFAPHRTQVDIEAVALNVAHAERGDNDGRTPRDEEIVPGGPAAYRPPANHAATVDFFLKQDLATRISFHAGTFLCNAVFYIGCHQVAQNDLQVAQFIHVPPMDDYQRFETATLELIGSWDTA